MDVLVASGSGFVGRPLCRVLDEWGHEVTAASHSPDVPGLPGGVETAVLDATREDVDATVAGHDAVVNLVALPAHVEPRDRSHETVHLGGTRRLVAASERTGVERFVQMSALGVDSGIDTAYFRAKRDAERVVRESTLEWVVYRPSVVFGDGCAFVPFVERSVPPAVVPLPDGGRWKLQPMWVGDLAPMVADGLKGGRHAGLVYRLGGPEVLTLAETVQRIAGQRTVVPLPDPLAALGSSVAEAVPGLPLGRDQYRALQHDNVAAPNDVSAFGVAADECTTLREYLEER